ncbi:hypothetical protein [Streptomyces sp. BRA346]|uniref:hypothetical protein n=1 Tax=Streptomyces sp. BRA346 TaxID=2878199 RepID=UPI0040643F9F
MTTIEELLSRALLLEEPRVPRDIVPPSDTESPTLLDASALSDEPVSLSHSAAYDLQTLCEAVVTHMAATSLRHFITEQLPEPSGARVLGCILQLTDAEDGARFWWQYAAGAGDDAASYCLYLYHLSLGETRLADWWREQTRINTRPTPETVTLPCDFEQTKEIVVDFDSSTPTVLRVLGQLLARADRPRPEVFDAVLAYVPGAVTIGYLANPEFEIPLPGTDFAARIEDILTRTSRPHAGTPRAQRRPSTGPKLPGRHQHAHANPSLCKQPVRGHR